MEHDAVSIATLHHVQRGYGLWYRDPGIQDVERVGISRRLDGADAAHPAHVYGCRIARVYHGRWRGGCGGSRFIVEDDAGTLCARVDDICVVVYHCLLTLVEQAQSVAVAHGRIGKPEAHPGLLPGSHPYRYQLLVYYGHAGAARDAPV